MKKKKKKQQHGYLELCRAIPSSSNSAEARAPSRKHRKRFELLMRNGARYLLPSLCLGRNSLSHVIRKVKRPGDAPGNIPRGWAMLASALESQFH